MTAFLRLRIGSLPLFWALVFAVGNLLVETNQAGFLNGLAVNYRYDPLLRLTNLLLTASGGTTLASNYFAYDAASRPKLAKLGTNSVAYAYEPNSDLIGSLYFTNGNT